MKTKVFGAIGLVTLFISLFAACQKEVIHDDPSDTALIPNAERQLAEQFSHYETIHYDAQAVYSTVRDLPEGATADIVLPFSENGAPWILHLTRNGVVQDDFYGTLFDGKSYANTQPLGIRTFEGTVEGGGMVSLTIAPDMMAGEIELGNQIWVLEPIQKYDGSRKGMAIAYREQDMLQRPAGNYCMEAPLPASEGHRLAPQQHPLDTAALAANCWQIETMVHGDQRYLTQVGGNPNVGLFLMVAAINNSSSRFTSINIRLFVPSGSAVQNTNPDNLSFDASTLLGQVRTIDNLYFPNVARDITLFFTGRNMTSGGSSGVAGIAYVAVLCNNKPYAYGVAETINGFYNTRIQTHEIGHMIGAGHDNACPNGGLMYPNAGSSCAGEYPSATSRGQINWHIWFNHGCIPMAAGC